MIRLSNLYYYGNTAD